MSAEPARKAPYANDLRWRIVWQRLVHGLTYAEISERLNIAVATAQRIYFLFEITGDVSPKLRSGSRKYMRRLDDYLELFVIGLVIDNLTIFLFELCQMVKDVSGIEVSPATICRLLYRSRHGMSHKKVRQVALQRSLDLRGIFMAQVLIYDRHKFIWLDETGYDNCNYMRKYYGYAIRGQTPVCHRILVRGTSLSVIAAISSDGLVACECTIPRPC